MQYRYERSQLRPELVRAFPRENDGPKPELKVGLGLGQILARDYRVEALRHAGDETLICAAQDLRRGRPAALKILPKPARPCAERINRFVDEIELAARVKHPNVVEMRELISAGDGVLLATMELLNGENLATTLARRGRLRWTRVRAILLDLCAGLAAIHAEGLVHCAVDPSNCVRGTGRGASTVKLLDFGAARRVDTRTTFCALEAAKAGTKLPFDPVYAAPELVNAEAVDPRCDVYALGALLCVLLTGKTPFPGATPHSQLLRGIYETPPALSSLGFDGMGSEKQIEAVYRRAMAKDREARFPSATAMAAALAAL